MISFLKITTYWTIFLILSGPKLEFVSFSRLAHFFNNYEVPTPKLEGEYDFVVIGAGSSGSVIANRLTEVPSWKVLLIEAGGEENIISNIPLLSQFSHLTKLNWDFESEPQNDSCLAFEGRRCKWPRGKGLGGTSIINSMFYTRGNALDYDAWEAQGNPGWGWKEVSKYFMKSVEKSSDDAGGHLDVTAANYRTKLLDAFMAAGSEMGYEEIDFNRGDKMGFGRVQVNQRNGARCSAAKAFLQPALSRPTLHILKETHATKILIDPRSKQVYGVEFQRSHRRGIVTVKKEVILSAGAINSPQLLMLSGIGPKDHLRSLDIEVIKDAAGVGQNLQDHVTTPGPMFFVNESAAMTESEVVTLPTLLNYVKNGAGPLTSPSGVEALAYVRTKFAQDTQKPDVEFIFSSGSFNSNIGKWLMHKILGLPQEYFETYLKATYKKHVWIIYPMVLHPRSRGWVKLKSNDPLAKPIMSGNYFSDPQDLEILVQGIKMAIEISKTTAFKKFNSTLHESSYPGCVHFKFASDEYWRCAARQITVNCHHQCGTAKMGPKSDPFSVVDHELKVRGIKGLRVADASIIPEIPAAHTNAVCFMIGEKVADEIKKVHVEK